MRIDLNAIDRDQFMVDEKEFDGLKVYLVQPQHIGCKWTQENSIFRSSVWDDLGNPVSLSWKKFVNWGENPAHFPVPTDLSKCSIVAKEDGSTLAVSLSPRSQKMMWRTRGTIDASKLRNGHEIAALQTKYPQIEEILLRHRLLNDEITLIFEWVSSENVIVIKYPETPDIILTGLIHHDDYSYAKQKELDVMAEHWKFKRPARHTFSSFEEMLQKVSDFEGVEGVCVYHSGDQQISKIKGQLYLKLHRFKEKANVPATVAIYDEMNFPSVADFRTLLETQFDHECMLMVADFIEPIVDSYAELFIKLDEIAAAIASWIHLPRKEAAMKIQSQFPDYSAYAFCLLNGKKYDMSKYQDVIIERVNEKLSQFSIYVPNNS